MALDELVQSAQSHSEKRAIKFDAIEKLPLTGSYSKGNDIEVLSFSRTPMGLELFARATKDGERLGFGDGTVEIERFRFDSLPILVDDPNGDIIRQWTDRDGVEHIRRLREDPEEAVRQRLAQVIRVTAKRSGIIIGGKVGNTVSTFSSAAGANSPVDGATLRDAAAGTWASIRDGAGTDASETETAQDCGFQDASSAGQWSYGARTYYLFDTSAIADTDAISAATLTLFGSTRKFNQAGNSPAWNIYNPSLAAANDIVTSDHAISGWSLIALATAIPYASWDNTGVGNVFTLNASGIANISKTGVDHFGMLEANYDADNVTPNASGSSNRTLVSTYFVDESGTALDPFLTVTHAAAAGGGRTGRLMMMGMGR